MTNSVPKALVAGFLPTLWYVVVGNNELRPVATETTLLVTDGVSPRKDNKTAWFS